MPIKNSRLNLADVPTPTGMDEVLYLDAVTGKWSSKIAAGTAAPIGGASGSGTAGQVATWLNSTTLQAGGTLGSAAFQNTGAFDAAGSASAAAAASFARSNGTLAGVASPTYAQGKLVYDTDNESLTFFNNDSTVALQVGQEQWMRVRNISGSTIPNGSAVYVTGANSGLPTIALAQANALATSVCVGLTTQSIANNTVGVVTVQGAVRGLNTAGFTAGATLYLSDSVAGGLTATRPSSPNLVRRLGVVGVSDAAVGTIHVSVEGLGQGDGTRGDMVVSNSGATWRSSGSLRAAGAVGDGTADDRPAFVSLDGSQPANYGILITGGRYRVGSNLTITRPLTFDDGGRIVVPTGVTVTINAPIQAGIEQIFELEGTGVVTVSPFYCADRYAEWWGAVLNADCAIPFAQAIKSGTRTLLQARDYNTTATMVIPAYATVQGAGYNWEGGDTATRVLMIGGTNTIVQLGSSTASPPDLNSAPCGATVYDVYFGRNAAPNAGSIGALIGWSRSARMERCRVTNSLTNYKVKNAISPFLIDLFSKRDTAIAGGQGADSFVGYDIDGTGALPAAGGNASVWLTRPQTELNIAITGSTAYWIRGRFTDTFVTQPECLGTDYGIDVLGDKGGSPTVGSNCNLVIENPVVDQTKVLGIRIRDVNQWGTVHVLQPYCGPATGDAITASNCDGHVGITTGQMRMNVSTSGKGITFDGCRSPQLTGTVIAECSTQALVLNNTAGGQFTPVIQNVTATLSAAVQAVASVTKSSIRPSINGAASKVSIGYQSLASSNAGNNISTAAIATGVVVTPLSYAAGAEVGSVYPDTAPIVARKTANQAMTAAVATAITDMAVTLEANSTYNIEIIVNIGAVSGTTPTMLYSLTGPASPTSVLLKRNQMITATTEAISAIAAFGAYVAGAVVLNTSTIIKGTVVTTAAGTLQLLVQMGGTTPSATVLAGSSITATKINVP